METSYEFNESSIPQNFKWRAGIGTNQKPISVQTPGDDYIEPIKPQCTDPFGASMAKAFLQSLNANKPSKVELPEIKKSKHDQYIDALMNNGVIWKTSEEDDRPETQAELQAKLHPIMINE